MVHKVISYYALTDGFRRLMADEAGDAVEFVPIGRLRNLGLLAMLRKIRGLNSERITVAVENEESRPLSGPLMLLAALSGSRKVEIRWPNGATEQIPRRKIVGHVVKVVAAQISSRVSHQIQIRKLKQFPKSATTVLCVKQDVPSNVLYLDANLSFGVAAGGSVGHTRGVIDGLIAAGFNVDYASCKALPTDNPKAHWLQVPATNLYGFPPELNYYAYNRHYEDLVLEWATRKRYAFIYQRMSLHNFSGAQLRAKLGIPLILEFNGSEAWAAANWHEKLKFHDDAIAAEEASLRHADLVVTVSEALGDDAAAAGVLRERIVVYPNGIDPTIFDPNRYSAADTRALRARLGIASNAVVATFIGTFGTWHGVDFLAKAVHRLIDRDRAWVEANRLHFLLVGDGLKMPEVKAQLGMEPYSRFATLTGLVPQREAPAYLAASDIFLSPHVPNQDGSVFFGSPTKLFEYMAMGRPIVAADLDQIGAVLKGQFFDKGSTCGPLAELFIPNDEDSFLEALRNVVDGPAAAHETGARARNEALDRYTWAKHVGSVLERMRLVGITRQ